MMFHSTTDTAIASTDVKNGLKIPKCKSP